MIIFGVIGGIAGWALSSRLGFNFWAAISAIVAASIIIPFLVFYFLAINDSENSLDYIQPMLRYFVDILPEVMATDISAAIVSAITRRS